MELTQEEKEQMQKLERLATDCLNVLRDGVDGFVPDMTVTLALMNEKLSRAVSDCEELQKQHIMGQINVLNQRFDLGLPLPTIEDMYAEALKRGPTV
jgi:hypothetical protein